MLRPRYMVELAKIITIGDMSGSSFMFSEREMLAFSVTLKGMYASKPFLGLEDSECPDYVFMNSNVLEGD